MSLHNFETVLAKLQGQPIREAKLMGMGEPYLHPQFDEICRLFKEAFPLARLITSTNCQYTMTESFKRSLQWVDYLYLSIDGWEANYERDRQPARWSKLLSFLEELRDLPRYGCQVAVNYVVNPHNIDDIPLVNNLLTCYNIDELRLNIAQDWNEDGSATLEYSAHDMDKLKVWARLIKGKTPWTYSDCWWPTRGFYSTVEGRVLTCPLNTAAKEHGNILAQSLSTVRSSKSLTTLAQGCASNQPTAHCRNCSYRQLAPLLSELGVWRLIPDTIKSTECLLTICSIVNSIAYMLVNEINHGHQSY